jgi:hypothetical protein
VLHQVSRTAKAIDARRGEHDAEVGRGEVGHGGNYEVGEGFGGVDSDDEGEGGAGGV